MWNEENTGRSAYNTVIVRHETLNRATLRGPLLVCSSSRKCRTGTDEFLAAHCASGGQCGWWQDGGASLPDEYEKVSRDIRYGFYRACIEEVAQQQQGSE
jgi:hypothetical protein